MKVLGGVLVLQLLVATLPTGWGTPAPMGGIINQAMQGMPMLKASGVIGTDSSPESIEHDTAFQLGNVRQYVGNGYSQVSSSQQLTNGANIGSYQDTTHHVVTQPGVGITIGLNHDHPVLPAGTSYQSNLLHENLQPAYYNGGQNHMTVTTTETKSHAMGSPYANVNPNVNNPNHVVLHLNMANHGINTKSEAVPMIQNTTPHPSKYIGSFGGAPGILGNQEKEGWGIKNNPAITVSVAHPENQGYPYGVGSTYVSTTGQQQQISGYQPQPNPAVIMETNKQTKYIGSFGGAPGILGNQAQPGYAINQKPSSVHLMISTPNQQAVQNQMQTTGVNANSNTYYSTSQQNAGVQTIMTPLPSTYQQKTIRKIETVQTAQPIAVQNTASMAGVNFQIGKSQVSQGGTIRCAADSLYGTTCGPNVLRDSYGNEIKKTTVQYNTGTVQYNPILPTVSTIIPTNTVQNVNKVSGYGVTVASVPKVKPLDRYIGNGMGNVAVTRVEKTSSVAAIPYTPQVQMVKPVVSVRVPAVTRAVEGRYVGSFGGAPGIITATGPATNTVTKVVTGTTVAKVPTVKNVYTQQRTTYVQPAVRQYAVGTTYASGPVINRGVTRTTYSRAIGSNVVGTKVSAVNNQVYAAAAVSPQVTYSRAIGSNIVGTKVSTINNQLYAPAVVPTQVTYSRAIGSNVVGTKVSTVNNQLYAPAAVPTQVTVRRYGVTTVPVQQTVNRINYGVASGGYEGANIVKVASTNNQVHSQVHQIPVQPIGANYYSSGTQYTSNAYGATKPAVAVHITPMMTVPVAHANIGGATYHETHDIHEAIPVKTTVQHTIYKTVNNDAAIQQVQPQQTNYNVAASSASYSPTEHAANTAEAAGGVLHHVMGGGAALLKLGSAMLGFGGSSNNKASFGAGSSQYVGTAPAAVRSLAEENPQTLNGVNYIPRVSTGYATPNYNIVSDRQVVGDENYKSTIPSPLSSADYYETRP